MSNKALIFLLGLIIGVLLGYYMFDKPIVSTKTETSKIEGKWDIDTVKSNVSKTFGFKKDSIIEIKSEKLLVSEKKNNITNKKSEKLLVSKNDSIVKNIKTYLVSKKVDNIDVSVTILSTIKPEEVNISLVIPEIKVTKIRVDTVIIKETNTVKVPPTFTDKVTYGIIGGVTVLLLILL